MPLRDPDDLPMARKCPCRSRPVRSSFPSTDPPHVRLCHTPFTNRYGHERFQRPGCAIPSICARTPPEFSVRERLRGHPSPHSRRLISRRPDVETLAVHVDQRSTLLLMTPVIVRSPLTRTARLSFGTLRVMSGLHGQVTPVMTRSVGLPVSGVYAPVAGGASVISSASPVQHRVQQLLDLSPDTRHNWSSLV